MKTSSLLCVLAVVLLSLIAPVSWAQSPPKEPTPEEIEKAKALFQEGEIFFQTGEFAKARDKYKESYILSKRPALLKNMALCEWNLKNYEEARHLYQAYLRTEPDTSKHEDVLQFIAELDDLIEKAKAQPSLSTLPTSMVITDPTPRKFKVWYVAVPAAILGGAALTVALVSGGGKFPETEFGVNPVGF